MREGSPLPFLTAGQGEGKRSSTDRLCPRAGQTPRGWTAPITSATAKQQHAELRNEFLCDAPRRRQAPWAQGRLPYVKQTLLPLEDGK